MRDPRERLRDVLEAIDAIARHAGGARAEFGSNELLQVWFLHNLQIIGEACRTLPPDMRAMAPDIPWSRTIGMRNVLVHGYFEIDPDIVWTAVSRDVPGLRPAMARLLAALDEPAPGDPRSATG